MPVNAGAAAKPGRRGSVAVTPVVMASSRVTVKVDGRGDQSRIDVVSARMQHAQKRKEAREKNKQARVDFKKAAGMIDFSMMLSTTNVANITKEQESMLDRSVKGKIRSKVHGVGFRGGLVNLDMGMGGLDSTLEEESSTNLAGRGTVVMTLAERRRLEAIEAEKERKRKAAAEKRANLAKAGFIIEGYNDQEAEGEDTFEEEVESDDSPKGRTTVRKGTRRGSVMPVNSIAGFGLATNNEEESALEMTGANPRRKIAGRRRWAGMSPRSSPGDMNHPTWQAFGLELMGLDLTEEEEEALGPTCKAAMRAGMALQIHKLGGGDGVTMEQEAMLDAHFDGKYLTSWVGFGLEVAGLQLSAEEESYMDTLSTTALATARVLLAHASLDATGLGMELEAALDAQARRGGVPSSWIAFGLELASLGLSESDEDALDLQSQAALNVARGVCGI